MRKDLPTLITRAKQNGMIVQLLTNGLMLTRRTFKQSVEAGLLRVAISLDTTDETLYQVLRGIQINRVLDGLEAAIRVRKTKPDFAIALKCVISKMNLEHISGLIALARKLHLYLSFQPLHTCFINDPQVKKALSCSPADSLLIQETVEEILAFQKESDLVINRPDYLANFPLFLLTGKQPETFVCEVADRVVNIDQDLNMKPCWIFPPSGNLLRAPLDDLWNGKEMALFREKAKSLRCKGCWLTCHADLYQNQASEE
jgi:MoaA/NifB/PqqE/SkfB family radical SAM enzyme